MVEIVKVGGKIMVEKKVKYKEAKQLKKGKEYLTKQYSLYFTKKESDTLELTPDKILYISNISLENSPALDGDIFKNAFQELDKLFIQLAKNPKSFNFREALTQIDISKIDKAKEVLKSE